MAENKKLKIKDWAEEDRPREKLLSKGTRTLTNAELIAILIGSGNIDETAVELSKRILQSVDNNLSELFRKGIAHLQTFSGIGQAKAVSIIAALELGKRSKDAGLPLRRQITQSSHAADYFMPLLSDLAHEEFWVMLLNRGNKIIDTFMVSSGGISGTVIDPRLIIKPAIEKLASSIILCHNHPSGTLQASPADLNITRKIKDAAQLMDITLLDHLITGPDKYLSLADEGML